MQENVVMPYRVTEKGDFLTYHIPRRYKRNTINNITSGYIHYSIKIQGEDYHLELIPNGAFLKSGSVQERYHVTSKRKIDDAYRGKMKTFSEDQCQYVGHVRDKYNSKAALSTCDGLMGYIMVDNNVYMIEPAQEQSVDNLGQLHILYQEKNSPPLTDSARLNRRTDHEAPSRDRGGRRRGRADPGYSRQMYLETLVVLDKTLIDFHKTLDLENYVLTVFNMAHTLFRDSTFGAPFELALVRMIRLETEDDEMNIGVTRDAPRVLEVFKAWAKRINPPLDSHPNHHDVAILITRVDICLKGDTNCGLLGLANLASLCDPEEQAVLVEDTGLALGFTIAHEIGHTLGMQHDAPEESGCDPTPYRDGYGVAMAKQVSIRTRGWSSCSREYLWTFIDAGMAACLYDEPSDHQFPIVEVLPGAVYGVAFQCRSLLDDTADSCPDVGVECDNMKCLVRGYGCVETHRALAEGTRCGPAAWCFRGKCTAEGQRPAARDGGSEWGPWSECSRSCGGGAMKAARSCDNPRPESGGFYCKGRRVRYEICNVQACAFGAPSFRDVQCAEFNSWLFPEDNKTHTWNSYTATSEKPCALLCMNELRQVAVLRSTATDGSECRLGPRHVCIAGQCQFVPCDRKLESLAVEDACGVCHGDGASCTLETGQKTFVKLSKAQLVLSVPVHTQLAVFEETSPTTGKFYVREGKHTILNGNKFGSTKLRKMDLWLGIVRHEQEILRISGPVTEALQVWMQTSQDVTVKYSVATPAKGRIGKYDWQYLGWSECSTQCGPGTENSLPMCVESATGHVEDKYCDVSQRPEELTRLCESRQCEPRWQVGEWSGCDCECPEDAADERAVDCVRRVGEAEGEDDVVDDKHCLPPKPISQRPCKCPKRPGRGMNKEKIQNKLTNAFNSVKVKFKSVGKVAKMKAKQVKHKVKGSATKLIDSNHLKNIKNMKQLKGKLVQDFEDLQSLELSLEIDKMNAGKNVLGFPKPHANENHVSVRGKDAVKIIQKVQKHNHDTSTVSCL